MTTDLQDKTVTFTDAELAELQDLINTVLQESLLAQNELKLIDGASVTGISAGRAIERAEFHIREYREATLNLEQLLYEKGLIVRAVTGGEAETGSWRERLDDIALLAHGNDPAEARLVGVQLALAKLTRDMDRTSASE